MLRIALIFLAGGLGSILRYFIGGWIQNWYSAPTTPLPAPDPAAATDSDAAAAQVAQAAQHLPAGVTFPIGTLLVNLIGCLLIGFLATALTGPVLIREEYRVAILVGLLGGFTTFSTFTFEALQLTNDRQFWQAGLYLLLSVAVGLIAAWAGSRLAQAIYGV